MFANWELNRIIETIDLNADINRMFVWVALDIASFTSTHGGDLKLKHVEAFCCMRHYKETYLRGTSISFGDRCPTLLIISSHAVNSSSASCRNMKTLTMSFD